MTCYFKPVGKKKKKPLGESMYSYALCFSQKVHILGKLECVKRK